MAFALIGCIVLGFAAGLFSFKVKLRWCRECGGLLTCPECRRNAHDVIRRPS